MLDKKRKPFHGYGMVVCLFWLLIGYSGIAQESNQSFGVFYTKIEQGNDWESYSRTREHTDVVVRLNADQRVAFWRGTSYLPVFFHGNDSTSFTSIVTRVGDGPSGRPDKINLFSFVKIIESGPEKAVVQWRYLPKFTGDVIRETNTDLFVDELFTFTKEGTVERIIRRGTSNPDEWNDPEFVERYSYQLTQDGIKELKYSALPNREVVLKSMAGNPVKGPNVVTPTHWWKFDEGAGKTTVEVYSGKSSNVQGGKTYWAPGVSGTALSLDGYTNFIESEMDMNASLSSTLELWVALNSAPFDQMGIFVVGDEGLYTDAEGRLIFKVGDSEVESDYFTLQGKYNKWLHIAAVKNNKILKLYLDGQLIGTGRCKKAYEKSGKFLLGHAATETPGTTPYTIEGLIDEFRYYTVALSEEQIRESRANFNPGPAILNNPNLENKVIPEGTTTGQFGARYEKLKYTSAWDNLHRDGDFADIVVEYEDSPVKTVFWRAATYSPFHSNGAKGRFSSEFNENFGPGGPEVDCCFEPMSDKKHEFSHARIIENTPARVLVHWRYALAKPNKLINHTNSETGWGDVSDWYMYCYPDGVCAYDMRFWSEDRSYFVEWSEGMILVGPGEDPRDVLPFQNTVTNANQTQIRNWDWSTSSRTLDAYSWDNDPELTIKPLIQRVNLKGSDYQPFLMHHEKNVQYWGPYIYWDRLSHWPLGQRASSLEVEADGINTRTSHFSLLKTIPPEFGDEGGHHKTGLVNGGGFVSQVRLEGMTNRSLDGLRHLQRSWANSPQIVTDTGVNAQYAFEQRAYVFDQHSDEITFSLKASIDQPLDNPCFVFKKWGNGEAQVLVNGKPASNLRQGLHLDTDGTQTLIVFLEMEAEKSTHFEVKKLK